MTDALTHMDPRPRRLGPCAPSVGGRWTPKRKAALLDRIDRGDLTVAEALARHDLTRAELDAWRAARARLGLRGLKADGGRTLKGAV